MTSTSNPIFVDYKSKECVQLIEFVKERNIKMVYWDLGGTLVDILDKVKTEKINEINTACKCQLTLSNYNNLLQKEWARRETLDEQQKIKLVKTDKDEIEYWKDFFRKAFKKYNLRKYPQVIEKLAKTYASANSFETYPYVENILEELGLIGIRTGIISNAFRSGRKILKRTELIKKFKSDYIILSCEYNSIKPEENIYRKAIEKTGVEAQEIVFIDDRESFLMQAVKLEMNALVIQHGTENSYPYREIERLQT